MIDPRRLGASPRTELKTIQMIGEDKFADPEKFIPRGVYCYSGRCRCPFWDKDETKEYQSNGYCHLLKKGDWEENGTYLLWDQCKECDINNDDCDFSE